MASPPNNTPLPSNYLLGETLPRSPTFKKRKSSHQPTRDCPDTRTGVARNTSKKRDVLDTGFGRHDEARYYRRKLHNTTMGSRDHVESLPSKHADPASILLATTRNSDFPTNANLPHQPLSAPIPCGATNLDPLPAPRPLHPSRAGFLDWQRQQKDPRSPKTPPLDTYLYPSSYDHSPDFASEYPSERADSSASTIRPESSISLRVNRQLRPVPNIGDLRREFQAAEALVQPRRDPGTDGPTMSLSRK